jgi:hypothetical protein
MAPVSFDIRIISVMTHSYLKEYIESVLMSKVNILHYLIDPILFRYGNETITATIATAIYHIYR